MRSETQPEPWPCRASKAWEKLRTCPYQCCGGRSPVRPELQGSRRKLTEVRKRSRLMGACRECAGALVQDLVWVGRG